MSFSGWAPTQCIVLNDYDTGSDPRSHPWCQFLESRGQSCHSYVPATREQGDLDLRDYLVAGYGNMLNQWAHTSGLGGRWQYKFYFWPDFNRGGRQMKCGTIAGITMNAPEPAPPSNTMIWHQGGRKYKKQTKRGRRKGRVTRRHGHKK